MRINDLLQHGVKVLEEAGVPKAEIDVQLLLGHCLGKSRTQLYLAANEEVSSTEESFFFELLERRKKREPVAYLLGEREFWSLPFYVDSNVLIPRPETEFLLETVTKKVRSSGWTGGPVLDLCCGSGVIATVLALEFGEAVVATDLSMPALRLAHKNSERHGVADKIDFVNCDLLTSLLPQKKFSLIVSNPPYVKKGEIFSLEPEVKDHEPHLALDGGLDGLDLIRSIHDSLAVTLAPGGHFFVEFGADQGEDMLELFRSNEPGKARFTHVEILKDYSGRNRVLYAKHE